MALALLMKPVATPPFLLLNLVTVRSQVPDCLTLKVSDSGPLHLLNALLVIVPMFLPARPLPFLRVPLADADLQVSTVPTCCP